MALDTSGPFAGSNSKISEVRKDAVSLLQLYGQIYKSQYTMYIGMINRINKASPVEMLFHIMEFLMERQSKIVRQKTLEIHSFETRLKVIGILLKAEIKKS